MKTGRLAAKWQGRKSKDMNAVVYTRSPLTPIEDAISGDYHALKRQRELLGYTRGVARRCWDAGSGQYRPRSCRTIDSLGRLNGEYADDRYVLLAVQALAHAEESFKQRWGFACVGDVHSLRRRASAGRGPVGGPVRGEPECTPLLCVKMDDFR